MVYEKWYRGLFEVILGYSYVICNYLHFRDNGWSNPSNTIWYRAYLIDMTVNMCMKHSLTFMNWIWGPWNPLLYHNSKVPPNWPLWANLGVPKKSKFVNYKYLRSHTWPMESNRSIKAEVVRIWGPWLTKNEEEVF